jgi:hypothetical protein
MRDYVVALSFLILVVAGARVLDVSVSQGDGSSGMNLDMNYCEDMARHSITLDPTAGTASESSTFYGSGHREQKDYRMKDGYARPNFTIIIGNDITHIDYSFRATKSGDIAITQSLSSKNAKQILAQKYASGDHGDQALASIGVYSPGYKANLGGFE